MGFFGKLFEKKTCDICGGEIGLLGNRKLEDGNLCKECARKLSPWFSDRRESTVEEIKEQLAYREANRQAVEAFHVTRQFGDNWKVYLDEDAGKFLITSASDYRSVNPDVLDCSQITSCQMNIDETRHEDLRTDDEGRRVSYNPPRYWFSYNFNMVIRVNHPYFDDMNFRLNVSPVEIRPIGRYTRTITPANNPDYARYRDLGEAIKDALEEARRQSRSQPAPEAPAPQPAAAPAAGPVTCPWCGATTTPGADGCCEYCGGSVNA